MPPHRLLLPLIVLGIGITAAQTQESTAPVAPAPLFHLTFDTDYNARTQANGSPTNATKRPSLVPGISGTAAGFERGTFLRYPAQGNLDKRQGTLSLWVQAPADGSGVEGIRYTLFREDGPNQRASTTIWFWQNGGPGLRFDLRDSMDQYLYVADTVHAPWQKGEWHHLAATWDGSSTHVYVDGALIAERSGITKWEPKLFEGFFLGASGADGDHSWGAAIDEVKIFDRPLSASEVRAEFLRFGTFTPALRLLDPYLTAGKTESVQLVLQNLDTSPIHLKSLRYSVTDATGKTVLAGPLPDQTLEGNKRVIVPLPVQLSTPGSYPLTLTYTLGNSTRTYSNVLTALAEKETPLATPSARTLVTEIDAAARSPLAESTTSRVVSSPLGSYREAGSGMRDRFAIDFTVKDVDAPHLAVITFPDDKPRTMEILLQDLGKGVHDYQGQSGVYTGDEYALSGKCLEHRFLFWPHTTQQSLIFMTAEAGRPAAVKNITIYRLDHLAPPLIVRPFTGSVPPRRIGQYYEDPVLSDNFGTTKDLAGFSVATDRLLDYLQSFGQDILYYPIVWYNGPLYGTLVEPQQPDIGGGIFGDRPHPVGYPAYLLKRLHARGMKFNATLESHLLPSLMPYILTDAARIQQGEETAVNIQRNGKAFFGNRNSTDPNLNPIDPHVLQAVKNLVNEIGDRYGAEPAFTGVTLVIARIKLFSFGSIESGYNDINLQRFQKASGIIIPDYKPGQPERFAASYKWLMANPAAKKAWIDWRCQMLHDHYKQIADALTARRPDLNLTLNLFMPQPFYERLSSYLEEPAVETFREIGIDPRLYAKDANIVMNFTLAPADFRWRRSLNENPVRLKDRRTLMQAPEILDTFLSAPQSSVIIHDRYWEDAIGRTAPLKGLSTDPKVREHPWRVSTLNPAARNSLEIYATALNNTDALEIVKGGFLIGTYGMEEELGAFSQSYRALPAVKFEDVPALADPVRVRQKVIDGKLYFYVLNRLPASAHVTITLAEKTSLEDAATGQSQPAATEIALNLAPFELRTFRVESTKPLVTGGQATPDPQWLAELQRRYEEALKEAATSAKAAPYLKLAEDCWTGHRYARLHFLLQESWTGPFRK